MTAPTRVTGSLADADGLTPIGETNAHADPQVVYKQLRGLAWSAGPHMCPAHVPARVIVREAVSAALHQLPGLRLTVPAEELGRIESPWGRCPATLPVEFTPVKTG